MQTASFRLRSSPSPDNRYELSKMQIAFVACLNFKAQYPLITKDPSVRS
jgi:hypothetical protein